MSSAEKPAIGAGSSPRMRLMAVLSAKQLGAEQTILMGRHQARTDLGLECGATNVVAELGEAGIGKVRELTGAMEPTPCLSA